MRNQYPIYIQNENGCVRNKDILNVSTSSDLCIFSSPTFSLDGAGKIMTGTTSADTNVYIVSADTQEIDLLLTFTGGVDSFTATNATFKYEIYKFNNDANIFEQPAVYSDGPFAYSELSAATGFSISVPVSELDLDGDYILKGYFEHDVCTDFLSKLGLRDDTSRFISGNQYGIYNSSTDYYMIAFTEAQVPIFGTLNDALQPLGSFLAYSVFPEFDGQSAFTLNQVFQGDIILALNGLVLAKDYDFVQDGNDITFTAATVLSDVITVAGVTNSNKAPLAHDTIMVDLVVSGITDGQGTDDIYFNTDSGFYEVFTSITPVTDNDIVLTLNGLELAPNIDYVQSISNSKRFILFGNIVVGDIINIYYNGLTDIVNEVFAQQPTIFWSIPIAPQLVNGEFEAQVSSSETFTTLVDSVVVPYVVNQNGYTAQLTITGGIGDELFYRVCNTKNYETLSGDIITDITYSETIPIILLSNALNGY